jgi:glycosyltransferase involved in cell wall biosynthesis
VPQPVNLAEVVGSAVSDRGSGDRIAARREHRVVIITGNHLCFNPRALKEADALASAGYRVEVLAASMDAAAAAQDRALMATRSWTLTVVADLTGGTARKLRAFRHRAGKVAHRRFGWQNAWQLGYVAPELYRAAHSRDGLFIAHSEQALWVAARLAREGRKVGVDMEDWFSEDLLPAARQTRPVSLIADFERSLLAGGAYRVCTSRAMSEALAKAYRVPRPEVVYNVFPWSDRATLDGLRNDRRAEGPISIHWFSQTIGAGRGLEHLLAALPLLHAPVEVHLRGQPSRDWPALLAKHCAPECRPCVFVHPLVSNDELTSRIAEHDIGFAGEQPFCPSRDLTVTNKLFQYLLGGLAVVATDTSGQREIAEHAPAAIRLCRVGDVASLAAALNAWLDDRDELRRAKEAALTAARDRYCWEREADRVVAAADTALGVPR